MSANMLSLDFENHAVRIVTSESGEKLFVGKDVCEVLGYADPTTAMRSHCKGGANPAPRSDCRRCTGNACHHPFRRYASDLR